MIIKVKLVSVEIKIEGNEMFIMENYELLI